MADAAEDIRQRMRGTTKAPKYDQLFSQNQENIFPFETLNKKKREILKRASQPSCFQFCCFCCYGSKEKGFRKRMPPRKKKLVTVVDILENIYVKYDPKLVNLLWDKDVFQPLEANKIRDDLLYFMPQLV
jgi:hypothetical protein